MTLSTHRRVFAALLTILSFASLSSLSPARAVTCEEAKGLSPSEVEYWAGRLETSPTHLSALLVKAFCEKRAEQQGVWAMTRPVTRTPLSDVIAPDNPKKQQKRR